MSYACTALNASCAWAGREAFKPDTNARYNAGRDCLVNFVINPFASHTPSTGGNAIPRLHQGLVAKRFREGLGSVESAELC